MSPASPSGDYRLEVFSASGPAGAERGRAAGRDGRADRQLLGLCRVMPAVHDCRVVDVFLLSGIPIPDLKIPSEVFVDEVAQRMLVDEPAAAGPLAGWDYLVEVTVRPGVTDPVALTAREALDLCLPEPIPPDAVVQTALQYLVFTGGAPVDTGELSRFFYNPLVQSAVCISTAEWAAGTRPPVRYEHTVPASPLTVESFDIAPLTDAQLLSLSRQRLLALSLEEMKAVQRHFSEPASGQARGSLGLPRGPTDVELEMIAQTWSEHCKHKIFNARVRYSEGGREQVIQSLFRTYIRSTTEALSRGRRGRRFLRSVFHDNSGVITFDRSTLVCFKVETHNSPSALDPYGGAITGIVGVNRDIMGTGLGAKPIFNTNVLCFASPDTPADEVPAGLLHPRRVLEGVHHGIVDGGNQSGIPVAAGAFLFDESYLGKPLVFCGTGGVLPARIRGRDACEKQVRPGDRAVMTGGRIGKDGIHGATFSSEALSETSPTSAVQIGDPITQKKMMDFLLEARDRGLYRGLTDNGAGGLSSSLGEMADLSGGVSIDLDACPLKYAGLAPWEILVSESQERMSLAVPPASIGAFLELARRRGVEATAVGTFTDTGRVEVTAGGKLVARLELEFLHGGLPVMDLPARWQPPAEVSAAAVSAAAVSSAAAPHAAVTPAAARASSETPALGLESARLSEMLRVLIADPNVRSREEWVRCYDHEVQARSVVKPFVGRRRDGPSDGAVFLVRHDSSRGITITHGICPRYGDHDTYDMAQCAVDEAVRAHVALGGDPRRMAALDNFCWPDPVESAGNADGAFKMAQLVRACRGLADACRAYGLPLISGKDSMKNDARVGGRTISIRPTLLVSLMGIIADVKRAQTTDFKQAGDLIYVVGETRGELGGTTVERQLGRRLGACPAVRAADAWRGYVRMHAAIRRGLVRSCHDLSDAGLWGALAESCLGGDLGASVSLDHVPAPAGLPRDPALLLFCETPSRFLVSISPGMRRPWERAMRTVPFACLGRVSSETVIHVDSGAAPLASVGLEEIRAAWNGRPAAGARA